MSRPPAPSHRVALRWWLDRHRRAVAAGCTGLAVWCGLLVLRPPAPPTTGVIAAARDLPAGTSLTAADFRLVRLPSAAVPAGSLSQPDDARGRTLAGPVRRGEPLTDLRLAGSQLLPPGQVAAPLRLGDPGVAALLRPGEQVDVLAVSGRPSPADPAPHPARLVGAGLTVLQIPAPPSASLGGAGNPGASGVGPGGDGPGLLMVAATPEVAAQLAAAAAAGAVTVTVRR